MAKETKVIEIRIDLFDTIERIGQLTQSIEENNSAISKLKKGDEDYQKQLGNLKTQIAAATTERRKLIASIVDEEKILKKRAAEIDKQVAKEQAQREKIDAIFVKSLEKEQSRLSKQKQQEDAYTAKKIAQEQKIAESARISAEKRDGYLNQLVISVNELEKAYYRLSKAELEGTKGTTILKNLKEQRAELQTAQAAYGKYSMNVGNYASATNMLAINLGQVMKEIPNFAISARIGIMSLTNNLPMLAEAFKAVRVQQQQMIAEGKAVPSMFSLITKSVFGLTGIMSIAMVLLQVFGEDIIKAVKNLFTADEAVKKLTSSQLGLNTSIQTMHDSLASGEVEDAIKNINSLEVSLRKSKGSVELQKKAVDDYNKSLGVTFGKVKDVDSALLLISKNKDKYIDAVKNMAIANAFFNQSAENMVRLMQISLKSNAEILGGEAEGYIDNIEKAQGRLKNGAKELQNVYNAAGQKVLEFVSIPENRLRTELLQASKAYNDAAELERSRQISLIESNNEVALKKATEYYGKYAEIVKKEGFTVTEEQKDQTNKGLKRIDSDIESFLAKVRKAIFDTNKNLIPSGEFDKEAQEKFRKQFQQRIDDEMQYEKVRREVNEMRFQDAVYYADLELATLESKNKATLDARLNLLEAERKAEVNNAKETGRSINEINEFYAAKRNEIKREETKAQIGATVDLLGAIASLWGENTKEYKIFATAQAVMNTWLGVTNALSQTKGGIVAQIAGAATALATGLAAVKKIWDVKTDAPKNQAAESAKASGTSTVKFHSGGVAGSTPDSPQRSEEITRTLLTTERVLSPQQTSIFDSLVAKVSAMGGSNAIVSGAAQVTSDVDRMYIAMSKALRDMPAPIMTWQEFERQQDRQRRLKNNAIIK